MPENELAGKIKTHQIYEQPEPGDAEANQTLIKSHIQKAGKY